MFETFFNNPLFNIGEKDFFAQQFLLAAVVLALAYFVFRLLAKRVIPRLADKYQVESANRNKVIRALRFFVAILAVLALVIIFNLDLNLFFSPGRSFKLSWLLEAFAIIQGARIFDWTITYILIHNNFIKRDLKKSKAQAEGEQLDQEANANRTVQYIVYVLAIILILRNFNFDLTIYTFQFSDNTVFDLRITNIFFAILIILLARLVLWFVTQLVLYGYFRQSKIDKGAQYAINRLIAYVIYFIASIVALESLGVQMTLIWGGAAALLVGIGLGLQQTFNDFFSGLVLLFERTVQVGDVLELGGIVGTVKKIGLRASILESRDSTSLVVPNSKLVNENVTNWTHYDSNVRFELVVSAAYGSDTKLVRNLLLQTSMENEYVLKYPPPFVRFNDFGDSGLSFTLYFFSRNYITIEDVKSDMRFRIDELFRENNIIIPFPQTDVWIRQESKS